MSEEEKGVVGIVGLGIMGGAFAQNLNAAGWQVIGCDVVAARRRTLARGASPSRPMPGDLAAKAPVIITSLPKASALAATVDAIVKAGVPRRGGNRGFDVQARRQGGGRGGVAQGRARFALRAAR